jgi:hypothetical protein
LRRFREKKLFDGQVGKRIFHIAILFSSHFKSTLEASKMGLDARMVIGDDGKQTGRSAKSDPLARKPDKKLEKKGAAPPEKPSLTVEEPTLSGSYETKKAPKVQHNCPDIRERQRQ